MNQTPTTTAAITQTQLACLGGVSPSFVSVHLDDFPESFFLRDGSNGRPPRCWTVEQIAQLILDRTGFLTEVECRLRLAIGPESRRKPIPNHRVIDTDHGHIVVPRQLGELSEEDRAAYLDVLERERAELRNRRAKRTATHATTPEE